MHIQPFQAVFPKLEFITATEPFFHAIKEEYLTFKERGFFKKAQFPAVFIYQIRTKTRHYTGIIASVAIGEYLQGNIKKHENTLAEKEQKQVQLFLHRKARLKPVLLTYKQKTQVSAWTANIVKHRDPFLVASFEEENTEHVLWEVKEESEIRQIQQLFATKVPVAYIADGHHRTTSTAILYEKSEAPEHKKKYGTLLCAFFPFSDLVIHDFNRVVEGMNNLPLAGFMTRIAQLFDLEVLTEPQRPSRKHDILMFINSEWYRLSWKASVLKNHSQESVILDSQLLNDLVMKDILGIEDMRQDARVDYVSGPKGLEGVWQKAMGKDQCIGFCLYPVLLSELIDLADRGMVLPPKSTWFEPRMKTGLIVLETP